MNTIKSASNRFRIDKSIRSDIYNDIGNMPEVSVRIGTIDNDMNYYAEVQKTAPNAT